MRKWSPNLDMNSTEWSRDVTSYLISYLILKSSEGKLTALSGSRHWHEGKRTGGKEEGGSSWGKGGWEERLRRGGTPHAIQSWGELIQLNGDSSTKTADTLPLSSHHTVISRGCWEDHGMAATGWSSSLQHHIEMPFYSQMNETFMLFFLLFFFFHPYSLSFFLGVFL